MRAAPVLLLAFGASSLAAGDLPRGTIIDRVVCRGNSQQSYSLYLPSAYTPSRAWPILYCLDPGARGRFPVDRFAAAAESAGFLVAGSHNSRNGPIEPIREAIQWLVADTHERLSIDDRRVYAAGFSGGARIALAWAQDAGLAGVVACGAGFGSSGPPPHLSFALFTAAGVDDFNHPELYALSRDLAKRRVPHRFADFPGGHEWLPAAVAAEAFDFFLGRVPPLPAKDSKEERRQADLSRHLSAQWAGADEHEKRSLLRALRKSAGNSADSPDRRVARRVLGGAFVGAMEEGRLRLEAKEFRAAADACETAVLVRPENPMAWYSLAVSQAASGNKRRALDALEKAAAAGFRDRERLERDPWLAPLRAEPRYQSVVASLPN